jgi:hypothetical protein
MNISYENIKKNEVPINHRFRKNALFFRGDGETVLRVNL